MGIISPTMRAAALLLLAAFTLVASVDGFYFHLYKYRLYALPATRREHLLHTLQAVLFPAALAPLFLADAGGLFAWGALLLNAAIFVLESADVFTEKASRAALGGLTPAEYWMHFCMSGLRWGYLALAFALVPAWTGAATWTWRLPSLADPLALVAWCIALGGIPVAFLHLALMSDGAVRKTLETQLFRRVVSA